jgi:KaiC/GvpD/RAD55 family RecA-like ATPase
MSILKVDIEGLDLVLGGGIHLLERVKGSGESATLLIRGPAGSGKTVFGTQLAASIARALQTDVAYGCVELLPTELRAQHENIRRPAFLEKVVVLAGPKETSEPDASHVRIYAAVLDLGEEGDTVKHLGGALEGLLEAAELRAERKVRVLVVDSLSADYGLGANAPRVLADGISKLAAGQGLIIILLEELVEDGPSVWSFAVDTVFELKLSKQNAFIGRQFLVPKNRLGPSAPGPHEFDFASQHGVSVCPSETAYLREWRYIELPKLPTEMPWSHPELDKLGWLPPFNSSVTALIGPDTAMLKRIAHGLGSLNGSSTGSDVDFQFMIGAHGLLDSDDSEDPSSRSWISSWHPDLMTGPAMLALLRSWLSKLRHDRKQLLRVIIGDLRDCQNSARTSDVSLTLSAIALLLRRLRVPLILVETAQHLDTRHLAAPLADVVLALTSTELGMKLRVTNVDGQEALVRPEYTSGSGGGG